MKSDKIKQYLRMEVDFINAIRSKNDEEADNLYKAMDELWLSMDEDEQDWLNARK